MRHRNDLLSKSGKLPKMSEKATNEETPLEKTKQLSREVIQLRTCIDLATIKLTH